MKKVTLILIMFLVFTGVVSATSINGEYSGKPIITIKSDGKELVVEDAPAVLMDGRTMVPIYMLRQIGLSVEWSSEEHSVDVTLPNTEETESSREILDVIKLTKDMQSYNVNYVEYVSNGSGFNQLSFYYNYSILDDGTRSKQLNTDYNEILFRSTASDVTSTRIYDNHGNTITVLTDFVRSFFANEITDDVFQNYIKIEYANMPQNENQPSQQQIQTTTSLELYSNDGRTYLGKVTSNEFDLESIFNEFGTYGSKFSLTSIWNEFGTYGSPFSSESAFNEFALSPPVIMSGSDIIGYLTVNSSINGAISPYGLKEELEKLGY